MHLWKVNGYKDRLLSFKVDLMEFSLSLPASIEQFRFTGTVQKGSHGRYALLPFFDGLLFLRLIPKYVYVSVFRAWFLMINITFLFVSFVS